jgi:hypothetical protein
VIGTGLFALAVTVLVLHVLRDSRRKASPPKT